MADQDPKDTVKEIRLAGVKRTRKLQELEESMGGMPIPETTRAMDMTLRAAQVELRAGEEGAGIETSGEVPGDVVLALAAWPDLYRWISESGVLGPHPEIVEPRWPPREAPVVLDVPASEVPPERPTLLQRVQVVPAPGERVCSKCGRAPAVPGQRWCAVDRAASLRASRERRRLKNA